MTASVRSASSGKNSGGTTITLTPPADVANGELWVAEIFTSGVTAIINDHAAKGWTRLDAAAVNSRTYSLLARIYNPSDPAGNYTLTQSAAGNTKYSSVAVRDHAVASMSDIIIGTKWLRGNNGGSQGLIVAPSLTTTSANMLAISFTGEASNPLSGYAVTTSNDSVIQTEAVEGAVANTELEWTTAWAKLQATPGSTGDLGLTYATASLNGIGQQIAIPSAPTVVPTTGQIGARVPTSVSSTSITMGVDRIGGDVVQIAAKLGATEVARHTVSVDATSGWGNATFTGLVPDAHYGFDFYVDGALQTDTEALIRTHPTPGTPTSFKFIAGSCQFTGSNHPIWERILEEGARGLGHMGDLHYADSLDPAVWRTAVESSLTAPRFRSMLGVLPMTWAWDNHDRIIVDDGGAGNALNFGRTDPATLSWWKQLAGASGWGVSNAGGRTWVIGRVRFIQTDNWTNKTDPDAGIVPSDQQTFLGAEQKQWFKETLDSATEPIIIWLAQWTTATTGSGRWDSYLAEKRELEAFINSRPDVKSRLVMIGGDSHSIQVTDGSRTQGNFVGVPSYNISGFNKSSATGQGGAGWTYDGPLRSADQSEADWGGYSRLSFTDDGSQIILLWEGVRVGPTGAADVMTSQTRVFAPESDEIKLIEWNGATEVILSPEEWTGATWSVLSIEEVS